eukprot:195300_1
MSRPQANRYHQLILGTNHHANLSIDLNGQNISEIGVTNSVNNTMNEFSNNWTTFFFAHVIIHYASEIQKQKIFITSLHEPGLNKIKINVDKINYIVGLMYSNKHFAPFYCDLSKQYAEILATTRGPYDSFHKLLEKVMKKTNLKIDQYQIKNIQAQTDRKNCLLHSVSIIGQIIKTNYCSTKQNINAFQPPLPLHKLIVIRRKLVSFMQTKHNIIINTDLSNRRSARVKKNTNSSDRSLVTNSFDEPLLITSSDDDDDNVESIQFHKVQCIIDLI